MSKSTTSYVNTVAVAVALGMLLTQMFGCTERSGTTESSIAGENAKVDHSADSASELDPETCLKLVFNKYCLGGSSVSLPPGGVNQGNGMISFGTTVEDAVFVQTNSDTIVAISRPFSPATWLVYQDLLEDIRQVYGTGEEHSYLPDWATSNDRKETAIATKQGRIQHVWRQGDWGVFIVWNDRETITLSYAIPDKMSQDDKGY